MTHNAFSALAAQLSAARIELELAGVDGLIAYFQDLPLDGHSIGADNAMTGAARIPAVVHALSQDSNPWVLEVVPAFASVYVRYDLMTTSLEQAVDAFFRVVNQLSKQPLTECSTYSQHWSVDVCYDSSIALDLLEVANHTGLAVQEVIERHIDVEYRVSAVGFSPGFAYLTGLDQRLVLPRKATPRKQVPAGSLAIAQGYSAVYPQATPGGWWLIGRALNSDVLTDAVVGDTVSFRSVGRDAFDGQERAND